MAGGQVKGAPDRARPAGSRFRASHILRHFHTRSGSTNVATVDKGKRRKMAKVYKLKRRIAGGSVIDSAPGTAIGRGSDIGNGIPIGIGNGNARGVKRRGLSHKRLPPERPEWEIRDAETSAAYFAFRCYRDMNPLERSIAAVAKLLGKQVTTLSTLSADYCWPARAAAWDYHIEQARLELSEQYQLDMFKRHGDVCCKLIDKVRERLDKLKPSELRPRDVAQWIDVATKIERLSRGVVNESSVANLTQINVQVDNMAKLSDADLEKIIQNEKKRKLRIGAIDIPVESSPGEGSPGGKGSSGGDVQ